MADKGVASPKYKSIQNIQFCSNKLIGGMKLIQIIDVEPFDPIIIGDGKVPNIWISVKQKHSPLVQLVIGNVSNHPLIDVSINKSARRVTVKIGTNVLINAMMKSNNSGVTCVIDKLDLRPVGFNIFGDDSGLTVGNSNMKGNTFKGVGYAVGINID